MFVLIFNVNFYINYLKNLKNLKIASKSEIDSLLPRTWVTESENGLRFQISLLVFEIFPLYNAYFFQYGRRYHGYRVKKIRKKILFVFF